MKIELLPLAEITPYEKNPRRNDLAVDAVVASIKQFGFRQPIVLDANGVIVCGHTRWKAAQKLGLAKVPVHIAADLTPKQARAYRLADNKTNDLSSWNVDLLAAELRELAGDSFDLGGLGFSLEDFGPGNNQGDGEKTAGALVERFGVPPFSVFDAKQSYWQKRKDEWLSLGIQSELGRDKNLVFSNSSQSIGTYKRKEEYERLIGREVSWDEFSAANQDGLLISTSVFDPVLCEIMIRWFSPSGGVVVDPFAGGSVRGVVASRLGRKYVGVELSGPQVEANKKQAMSMCRDPVPEWIEGDSCFIRTLAEGVSADFVLSCPPYADLERYSENPRDLSTMDYPDFLAAYSLIIGETAAMLKDNRFACFVVADIRDDNGFFRGFVADTIRAFEDCGLKLYNEAVLLNALCSAPIRASLGMRKRKLTKVHQNVLVFIKGSWKQASSDLGDIESWSIDDGHDDSG